MYARRHNIFTRPAISPSKLTHVSVGRAISCTLAPAAGNSFLLKRTCLLLRVGAPELRFQQVQRALVSSLLSALSLIYGRRSFVLSFVEKCAFSPHPYIQREAAATTEREKEIKGA